MTAPNQPHLTHNAAAEAKIWDQHQYYDDAEKYMEEQWSVLVQPFLEGCDFETVVDLAAGHGRNSKRLLERTKRLYIVDFLQSNIEFCQQRFAGDSRVTYIRNTGFDLQAIAADSVSLVYCWDAMVHFDSDIVRSYLREFRRILKPGGKAFCHHSNWMGNPGGFESPGERGIGPHRRNFMSKALYAHYAIKEDLEVVRQRTIQWNTPDLDCMSLVMRPLRK
jgi:ubiquinone/menaquinone biosynthesis C-methylase UbiE